MALRAKHKSKFSSPSILQFQPFNSAGKTPLVGQNTCINQERLHYFSVNSGGVWTLLAGYSDRPDNYRIQKNISS
jgi:hypothetical protein